MIPNIAEVCRQHLDYMRWADEVAIEAVARQMPESLKTLQHIYLAEQVWLARVWGILWLGSIQRMRRAM
jgi:hypothetical protein